MIRKKSPAATGLKELNFRSGSMQRRPEETPVCAPSQNLKANVMFMSGWPPSEAVLGSVDSFANVLGFRKSTVVVGVLKLYVFRQFWKSQRNCAVSFSVILKFFAAETWDHNSRVPVVMFLPALPGVKAAG
jgi:hypothetical protein